MIATVNRISDWDSGTEIIYGCRKCKASFAILGHREKFCHGCGTKVEWKYMPTHLTKPLHELGIVTVEQKAEFIRMLNKAIQNKEYVNTDEENEE